LGNSKVNVLHIDSVKEASPATAEFGWFFGGGGIFKSIFLDKEIDKLKFKYVHAVLMNSQSMGQRVSSLGV
jgi:hypothetical protein